MTLSFSSPANSRPVATGLARRLRAALQAVLGRIDRAGLPARLDRTSDDQLRDRGLTRSDSDWLRGQGSSQDAATRLAIRSGQRAGNW